MSASRTLRQEIEAMGQHDSDLQEHIARLEQEKRQQEKRLTRLYDEIKLTKIKNDQTNKNLLSEQTRMSELLVSQAALNSAQQEAFDRGPTTAEQETEKPLQVVTGDIGVALQASAEPRSSEPHQSQKVD